MMLLRKSLIALILLCIVSLPLLAKKNNDPVLAIYKGGKVLKSEIDYRISKFPTTYKNKYTTVKGQKDILDMICTERIFLAEGVALGKDKNIEHTIIKQLKPYIVDSYRNKEFSKEIKVTKKDIKKYYKDNIEKLYTQGESYRIFYIQAANDSAAEMISAEYKKGTDLLDVMNQYSINKFSKKRGGYIGNIRLNSYIVGVGHDDKMDSLIVNAPMNEFVGPYKTKTGIHFFKVVEHNKAKVTPLKEVEGEIRTTVKGIKESANFRKKKKKLMKHYTVIIDNEVLKRVNLDNYQMTKPELLQEIVKSSIPGLQLTVKDFMSKLKRMHPQEQARAKTMKGKLDIVNTLIEDDLFYFDALQKNYAKDKDVLENSKFIRENEIMRRTYMEIVINKISIPHEEIVNYYENSKTNFLTKAYRKIRQFKFESEKEAIETREKLIEYEDDKDFDDIKEIISKYTGRNDGIIERVYKHGNIVGLGKDDNYKKLVWETELDNYSIPFKNVRGDYIVFKVMGEMPPIPRPMKEVAPQINTLLKRRATKTKFEEVKLALESKYSLKKFPEKIKNIYTAKELFGFAETAQKERKYEDAIIYYDQVIENHKNNVDDYKAMFMKAFVYSEDLKDNVKAKIFFKKVINDFPKSELHESAHFMLKSINGEANLMKNLEE